MKKMILLIFLLSSFGVYAGTCSSISRTDVSANSVLTSTKYNADNNTAYSFLNAYDAGCVTDETLEVGALDKTTLSGFAVPLNSIVSGCKVTWASAATLSIAPCMIAVNDKWVKTATPVTVAWTDIDTGSEEASTQYYVYVDSTSANTTIVPVISKTAPGSYGFNGSDKVIASFWNDSSQDIVAHVRQWEQSAFDDSRYTYDLTVAVADWTTVSAKGIYYKTADGGHRLRFNIAGTLGTPATSPLPAISGITFPAYNQAVVVSGIAAATVFPYRSYATASDSTITIRMAAVTDVFYISGDVEIAAKPDWAN